MTVSYYALENKIQYFYPQTNFGSNPSYGSWVLTKNTGVSKKWSHFLDQQLIVQNAPMAFIYSQNAANKISSEINAFIS